jgi:fatty acid desaturase
LNIGHNSGRMTIAARTLREILSGYRDPSGLRSIAEIAITALPLIALWVTAWLTYSLGHPWASLLTVAPAFSSACSLSSTTAVTVRSFPTGVRTIGSAVSSA